MTSSQCEHRMAGGVGWAGVYVHCARQELLALADVRHRFSILHSSIASQSESGPEWLRLQAAIEVCSQRRTAAALCYS